MFFADGAKNGNTINHSNLPDLMPICTGTDRQGQTDGRTDRQTDERTDRQTDGQTRRKRKRQKDTGKRQKDTGEKKQ